MRERSRIEPVTHVVDSGIVYQPLPSGKPVNEPNMAYDYTGAAETIIDDPHNRFIDVAGSRRRLYKPVMHQRWTCTSLASQTRIYTNWNYSGTSNISAPGQAKVLGCGPSDYGTGLASIIHGKLTSVFTGHYDRWLKAKPTMATRANLTVFVAELKDIKSMFDLLPSKHFSLDNWRDAIKYANGQHLNYNFGWKPFCSDIIATYNAVASFETRLNKFLRNENKLLTRTVCGSELSQSWEGSYPTSTSFWKCRYRAELKEKLCSSFMYSYDIPAYSKSEMRWRAWADSLGINPSIATLWELTPLSFVVDWFVNVGAVLEATNEDWIAPYLTWVQAQSSRKAEGQLSWWVQNVYGQVLPGFSVTLSQYDRQLGFPHITMETDNLDADKIRLGLSLMLARF